MWSSEVQPGPNATCLLIFQILRLRGNWEILGGSRVRTSCGSNSEEQLDPSAGVL